MCDSSVWYVPLWETRMNPYWEMWKVLKILWNKNWRFHGINFFKTVTRNRHHPQLSREPASTVHGEFVVLQRGSQIEYWSRSPRQSLRPKQLVKNIAGQGCLNHGHSHSGSLTWPDVRQTDFRSRKTFFKEHMGPNSDWDHGDGGRAKELPIMFSRPKTGLRMLHWEAVHVIC